MQDIGRLSKHAPHGAGGHSWPSLMAVRGEIALVDPEGIERDARQPAVGEGNLVESHRKSSLRILAPSAAKIVSRGASPMTRVTSCAVIPRCSWRAGVARKSIRGDVALKSWNARAAVIVKPMAAAAAMAITFRFTVSSICKRGFSSRGKCSPARRGRAPSSWRRRRVLLRDTTIGLVGRVGRGGWASADGVCAKPSRTSESADHQISVIRRSPVLVIAVNSFAREAADRCVATARASLRGSPRSAIRSAI